MVVLKLALQRVRNVRLLSPRIFALANSQFSTAAEQSWRNGNSLRVPNLVGGSFADSESSESIDVLNPATQEAFPSWQNTPITARQCVMFKLQDLIRKNMDKLALNITTEQGKTLKDAQGDVFRGLEVVEHACGMATLQMGEYVSNMSSGIL
ncbi:unnamed protein product [Fraxinus pennsylvanica]|uniref:Aldehyde dehydrogenase domain-containing protein n=1 Tax=Fraxinus pennsylvanica TaxID=56036 RepID=A0AAD1ZJ35_9LAMI|nr:unnamed protein product [Fraxinus pennsylvanica]